MDQEPPVDDHPPNAPQKPASMEALELIMDDRELKSPVAKLLFSRGVKLRPKRLEVADFIINEQIALERKTAQDFESSIMDGRLFSQCRDLAANFQYPLICIVGREFGHLHKKAIIGAQISVATQFRIPIFQLESEEELADFIHILLVQRSKPPKDMKLRFEKKALSKDDQLQMVIEGVSMIGPVHAKSLLKKFKTIQKVFSASEKQMQKVEGIGEIRAKQIRKIATAVYGEEDLAQSKLPTHTG
ncbi:MAG TPA: ERCC4 domain-containing protein [Candidatus Norongarragalinales archaeon]|nr:ERCC4 domain-containing protein [Candidatus Norongarragalinales archaeon]